MLENNVLSVPVAIIVAGAMIAGAIYFQQGQSINNLAGAGSDSQVTGEVAQPEPEAPTIGDFEPVSDSDHLRGNPNAKLTIIEYSDLECPFCQRFHPTVEQILEEYPNDVNWTYRHFPLGIHPGARPKAIAAECAAEQGKFWEFTDTLFDAGTQVPVTELANIAQRSGVTNTEQFQTCLDNEKYADKVADQEKDAQVAGGRGTPYSLIVDADGNATPINGAQPYETVKAAVEAAL